MDISEEDKKKVTGTVKKVVKAAAFLGAGALATGFMNGDLSVGNDDLDQFIPAATLAAMAEARRRSSS